MTKRIEGLSKCTNNINIISFSLSSLQLRPQLPSRRATQTRFPTRCACSWKSAKSVKRSCRRPRQEPSSPERWPKPAPPLPTAPLLINQPGRMQGWSSRETKGGAPRSRKAKDRKLERAMEQKNGGKTKREREECVNQWGPIYWR